MILHATGGDLLIKEKDRLISGSVNMYTCEFTFDESWAGYTVTVVFSTGNRLVNMALVDGKCDIPSEVLRPNARIRIGIFGTDGVRSRPTTYSEWISVEQGADVTGTSAQPPTPSVYEQWISALDEQHEEWAEAEQARVEAENARAEAEQVRQDLESGYVARAEAAAESASESAAKASEIAGGDFATTSEAKGYADTAEANAKSHADGKVSEHNNDETAHGDIRDAITAVETYAGDQATAALNSANEYTDSKMPTYTEAAMTASGWSENTYSFEADYPAENYNISIEVAPTATAEQFEAFGGAMICGSADSNIATALGDVPTVDIPIIIKVVAK